MIAGGWQCGPGGELGLPRLVCWLWLRAGGRGALYVGAVAGAHLRGVCAAVQQAGAHGWVFNISRLDVPNLPCRITGTEP